jgi:hypothetical protein
LSCIKNNIKTNTLSLEIDEQLSNIENWEEMDTEEFVDRLRHAHEPINDLTDKFGNHYPIISIKRNKYDRFISLWKHIIDETYRIGEPEIGDIFSKLTVDDLIGNVTSNYLVGNEIQVTISQFFDNLNLPIAKDPGYIRNMIFILYQPISQLTNNDPNIIWFDIDKLNELEEWVSKKLDRSFKLEKVNSSQHYNCALELNDDFKEKYDKLYNVFDTPKINKSLI